MRSKRGLTVPLFALCTVLASCAMPPVQPWEKGTLARPDMGFDSDPLEARFADHTYTSKEAARGGSGVGGGGCGCN